MEMPGEIEHESLPNASRPTALYKDILSNHALLLGWVFGFKAKSFPMIIKSKPYFRKLLKY